MTHPFHPISAALTDLQQGKMVVLFDSEHREAEGDLVMAAEKVTPEAINFMLKHARGSFHLTLPEETIQRLDIPLMPQRSSHRNQAAFTASIEAVKGVASGASVQDRAQTIRVAINPRSTAADISLPGHIFPLQARSGAVLERPGHTEGSVDLARLAGLIPAGLNCEILQEDGSMAKLPDLIDFAKQHHLKLISITDLIAYRQTFTI